MTTTSETTANVPVGLSAGECLLGHIVKPFIKEDKLLGAILSFDGRSETALLHIRQMTGEKPAERLAELGVGDSLMVRILIQEDVPGRRAVWATEKGVEHSLLIEMFEADKEKFRGLEGRIHGLTDYGVFIELLDSPAKGHRGLLRHGNVSQQGRVKLGSFVTWKLGDFVQCDMAEIRVDNSNKLLIRVENARPRSAATA
jgi:predicted RNA-binding protein with RPS1 domain